MFGCGLLFGLAFWQEYRTRYGVRWQVYQEGVEWSRGSVVRRLAFRDVKQIGVTQRMVVTANSGIPVSGYLALRLADEVNAANPIELVVRYEAMPNSPLTRKLTAVRADLMTRLAAQMREELQRGRVSWAGCVELTELGVIQTDGRGERLVLWEEVRRLVLDVQNEQFRMPEQGAKGSRVRGADNRPELLPWPGVGAGEDRPGRRTCRPGVTLRVRQAVSITTKLACWRIDGRKKSLVCPSTSA